MTLLLTTLLGGLGLFLLAVTMITDGLKLAAGSALKNVLGRYTSTPARGVLSGILVTGMVQSSSAVTVATIGFVNAGLLSLRQSLGVVYGANIGTTMTGWLVAATGLDLDLEAFALPLVGVGMLGRLLLRRGRSAAVAEAVAGFGLFFVGVEVLRQAFMGLAGSVDAAALAPAGGAGLILYVGLGFLMTLLTQSSSAAIALTLTAAASGAVGLDAAAATVIGANVGTTSTAALATIGATANARRVAAAHVIFNLITAVAALALLPALLYTARLLSTAVGFDAPVATLALFHTVFNVLGVALMWPLTPRLAELLSARFVTPAESLARPRYLDRTVLVAPVLALEALRRELLRALSITRTAASMAVSAGNGGSRDFEEQLHGLRGLLEAVEEFAAALEAERLPPAQSGDLPLLLRITNYLEDTVSLAATLEHHRADLETVARPPVLEAVAGFQADVVRQLDRCRPDAADFDRHAAANGFAGLEQHWHELKTTLLEAASRRAVPLGQLNEALEGLRSALRMAEQLTKAAVRLAALSPAPPTQPEPTTEGTPAAAEAGPGAQPAQSVGQD